MKKFSFAMSLVLLLALVLTACAGGDNNTNETPGVLETPGAAETLPALETPAGGLETQVEPTTAPTLAETPVVDLTATPLANVTGTPEANVPVTGEDKCYPNRLSKFFDYSVVKDGEEVAEVDGVVIFRDAAGAMPGAATDGQVADATPAATPDATVEAGAAGSGVVLDAANMAAPNIAYLIVNTEEDGKLGDKDVLLPFSAVTLPVDQPADVNADVEVVDNCVLTLTTDLESLNNAPNIDHGSILNGELDLNVENWDEQFRTYWTGLGFNVIEADSTTGAQLGNPVVFTDDFKDIDVENNTGDDLGEIDEFILDPQTGQIQYAIIGAGGFLGLGEKYIAVPLNKIAWVDVSNDFKDPGKAVINVPEDAFKNAPAFDSLDKFGPTIDWNPDIDTYWQGIQTPPSQ